jgi:hypothetical protein
MHRALFRLLIALLPLPATAVADTPLVVHEWGTFTALQDEDGHAIGGVNSQDEPLPYWTHDLAMMLIIGNAVQGAPKCHPDVTLRLETPVIYFHRGDDGKKPLMLDVRARFRGGWLTQFYPDAAADAPGLQEGTFRFGPITGDTVGELLWKGISVGGRTVGPETTDHVWLAPRKVTADSVTTARGESERFLFYRGVAHVDAPLRVSRTNGGAELLIRASGSAPRPSGTMWLVDVRADGRIAQRPLEWRGDDVRTLATFPAHGYGKESLETLRSAMRRALEAQGLFPDEAAAVLDTWALSYFKSPGLRLFFMVPRSWTDAVLPLDISVPADLTRVMVGRIEIVTPEQRAALCEMARPSSEVTKVYSLRRNLLRQKLGRFADALILDDARRRATRSP